VSNNISPNHPRATSLTSRPFEKLGNSQESRDIPESNQPQPVVYLELCTQWDTFQFSQRWFQPEDSDALKSFFWLSRRKKDGKPQGVSIRRGEMASLITALQKILDGADPPEQPPREQNPSRSEVPTWLQRQRDRGGR